jgi:hypothetical protein
VGLICLAPLKGQHGVRASDGVFVHDMDPLIDKAGAKVLSARWIGTTTSGSSPSHVIIAEPRVCPQIKELTTVWDRIKLNCAPAIAAGCALPPEVGRVRGMVGVHARVRGTA